MQHKKGRPSGRPHEIFNHWRINFLILYINISTRSKKTDTRPLRRTFSFGEGIRSNNLFGLTMLQCALFFKRSEDREIFLFCLAYHAMGNISRPNKIAWLVKESDFDSFEETMIKSWIRRFGCVEESTSNILFCVVVLVSSLELQMDYSNTHFWPASCYSLVRLIPLKTGCGGHTHGW